MFSMTFTEQETGLVIQAFSEQMYPNKEYYGYDIEYSDFSGEIPEELIGGQDPNGLDIYLAPDQYELWAKDFL